MDPGNASSTTPGKILICLHQRLYGQANLQHTKLQSCGRTVLLYARGGGYSFLRSMDWSLKGQWVGQFDRTRIADSNEDIISVVDYTKQEDVD